jgi:hypothetical protein
MMEAVRTSETSVNIYQATRRNIPEDSRLHIRRRENLESHLLDKFITFGQECACAILVDELLFSAGCAERSTHFVSGWYVVALGSNVLVWRAGMRNISSNDIPLHRKGSLRRATLNN